MKMKPQSKKKLIIIGISIIIVSALCVCGIMIAKKFTTKTVNVYAVSDMMQDAEMDAVTITGTVMNSSVHTYPLKSGLLLSKVYVKTGDKVKKGDKLFQYDMSVKELELDKKKLEKQDTELSNRDLQDEIRNLKAGKNPDGTKIDSSDEEEGAESDLGLEPDANSEIDEKNEELGDGADYKGAAGDEEEEDISEDEGTEDESGDSTTVENGGESVKEMIAEREKEIRDNNLTIRQQEINISKLEKELNDNVVKSTVDGIVKSAGTVKKANENVEVDYSALESDDDSESDDSGVEDTMPDTSLTDETENTEDATSAFVTIQTTKGSFVQTAIDEYSLSMLNVGDQLMGMSYNSSEEITATITEKSEFPIEDENSSYVVDGDMSGNVSYYSVMAKLDDSVELQDQDYVELQLPTADISDSAFYIENAFVLNENGNNYVYIRDKDKKLKKKKVVVVRKSSDGMTQIDGGLTEDDYIAFPYGKAVQEGAPTKKSDIDTLYE